MSSEARLVLQGFLSAEYGRDSDARAVLSIGGHDASALTRHWITAFNPLGLRCTPHVNEAAQRAMLNTLDAAGHRWELGYARSPAGSTEAWFEPCAVVNGAEDAYIDDLARRFRQLATVALQPGLPARLRCYRGCWIERFGVADMDAANVDWVA